MSGRAYLVDDESSLCLVDSTDGDVLEYGIGEGLFISCATLVEAVEGYFSWYVLLDGVDEL